MAAPLLRVLQKSAKNITNLHQSWRYMSTPPTSLYPTKIYRRQHRLDTVEYVGEAPIAESSWKEIQEEVNKEKNAELASKVDIGRVWNNQRKEWKQLRKETLAKNQENTELELTTRLEKHMPSLDEIDDIYRSETAPNDKKTIAKHYGIYSDLFDNDFFTPVTELDVCYDCGETDSDDVLPVFSGNEISPSQATNQPHVTFDAEEGVFYTLILTNPDGHLLDNESEYLHWMICNIKDGDISSGDVLCDYLRPFPPRGTGWHRHVFLLFKQTQQLDLCAYKRSTNCTSLKERTFQTLQFYKENQETVTPVGLSFFQSEWDQSVKQTYHHILNMKEPSFEYAHQQEYRAVQVRYPNNQAFDRYFDKYRDKKDLAEEAIRERMRATNPFAPPQNGPDPYGQVWNPEYKRTPTWLNRKKELMHRRVEYFKDIDIDA